MARLPPLRSRVSQVPQGRTPSGLRVCQRPVPLVFRVFRCKLGMVAVSCLLHMYVPSSPPRLILRLVLFSVGLVNCAHLFCFSLVDLPGLRIKPKDTTKKTVFLGRSKGSRASRFMLSVERPSVRVPPCHPPFLDTTPLPGYTVVGAFGGFFFYPSTF